MKQPSLSPQQPDDSPTPTTSPAYEVVGLVVSDHMPLVFRGQTYDLAKLSDLELDTLLSVPDQVPFLQKL